MYLPDSAATSLRIYNTEARALRLKKHPKSLATTCSASLHSSWTPR